MIHQFGSSTGAWCAGLVASCLAGVACHGSAAPPEEVGETALHRAAREGDVVVLRGEVAPEALNAIDLQGRTPLLVAVLAGRADSVNALIEAGADLDRSHRGVGSPVEAAERGDRSNAVPHSGHRAPRLCERV